MATSTMLVVYISTDSCQDRAFQCIAMVSVSTLVIAVMGLKIALMVVMKVDVVNHSLVG